MGSPISAMHHEVVPEARRTTWFLRKRDGGTERQGRYTVDVSTATIEWEDGKRSLMRVEGDELYLSEAPAEGRYSIDVPVEARYSQGNRM